MISKSKILLIVILIMMVIGVFGRTPLSMTVTYLLLVVSTIGHVVFVKNYRRFAKSFNFWYCMGISLMFLSIIMQKIINNQSFVSGFVANFRFYNTGVVVLVYFLLLRYKISYIKFFLALKKAGWINFFAIFIMSLLGIVFINESEITGLVTEVTSGNISKIFIELIAIIYLSYFIVTANFKYLFYTLILFSMHHILELQRFVLLVQLAVVSVAILKVKSKKVKSRLIIPIVFVSCFAILFVTSTETGSSAIERFSQAFSIFTEEKTERIEDYSSAARIYESEIAMKYFYTSPIVGNGLYRSSESEKIFGGEYFYLSDIGVVGVMYVFGVLGLIVLFLQYRYLFRLRVLMGPNVFFNASLLFLLFLLLFSLLTGMSILHYSNFLLSVFLIEYTKSLGFNKSHHGKK